MAEINYAFFNCKQRRDEKMSSYFRRLQTILNESKKLLRAKFPDNHKGSLQNQEEESVNVFNRGTTNPGLRQHLLMSPAATLTELNMVAKPYEKAEKTVASGTNLITA